MSSGKQIIAGRSKWYNTIRGKFFLVFSLLVLFFSAFILIYIPIRLRHQAMSSIEEKAETLAEITAFFTSPALYFEDPESVEAGLIKMKNNPKIAFVVILDKNEEIFAGYGNEKVEQLGYANIKEGVSKNKDYYLTNVPLMHEGEEIGHLYLGHSLEVMNSSISESRNWIAGISALFLVLGILFVYMVSVALTRNLRSIVSAVRKIGHGDFSQRAIVDSRDETGVLATSFNLMLQNLEDSTDALKRREIQYRSLAENMNEGLVQIGEGMTILYANPRFCKLFSYQESDVLGNNIYEIIGLNDQRPERGQLFAPTGSDQVEIRLIDREGKDMWVLVSSVATDQGRSINAIFTEITRLKQTEADLLYKNRELDTFVYKASHDLKAPLSSLRGLTDIAKSETNSDDGVQSYLGLIERTIDKMDEVLLGLLEVTWIKQGSLEYVELELKDLVSIVQRAIEHAPGYESVQFIYEIPDGFLLNSDVKMMSSVLQNLIFNAIKYHREDDSEKWVRVSASRTATRTIISVKDNGPGIPLEARDHVFDMFYRASLKSQGSGLGLYIVKNSIEKMGGTVRLKSQIGIGTEFIVDLPNIPLEVN
ncbi:MAG TPA: HAMP domain-containing protein [Bacteroidetes bacterium]|nr:HAMP domain-containing protein [Bacteroidota bacterium]